MSAVESCANVAVGYGVAVTAQVIVFPWFGIHVGMRENLGIGVVFTVVSLLRSFVIRRLFNAISPLAPPFARCGGG